MVRLDPEAWGPGDLLSRQRAAATQDPDSGAGPGCCDHSRTAAGLGQHRDLCSLDIPDGLQWALTHRSREQDTNSLENLNLEITSTPSVSLTWPLPKGTSPQGIRMRPPSRVGPKDHPEVQWESWGQSKRGRQSPPCGASGKGPSVHGDWENREAWGPHSFTGLLIPVFLQYPAVPRRQAVLGAGTTVGTAGSAQCSPPGSARSSPRQRRERHPSGVQSTICSLCDSLGTTEPLPSRGGAARRQSPPWALRKSTHPGSGL